MDHLSRLLYKTHCWQDGRKESLSLGFIEEDYETGMWTLSAHLWDGVPGSSGQRLESTHRTLDEALARFEELEATDPVCLITDYGECEGLMLSQSADS